MITFLYIGHTPFQTRQDQEWEIIGQASPLHSWHWGLLSWTATYLPPTNDWGNQPEQAIKRRPFLSASPSPIFQDSCSEETPWSTNCPETRSVSGSWRFTKFHFTDCAIQSVPHQSAGRARSLASSGGAGANPGQVWATWGQSCLSWTWSGPRVSWSG